MAEDIAALLLAKQQQASQGGKQGPLDGMINKGAQTLNGQALGFDKPIFGGAGILGLIANGGAYSSKNPGLKSVARTIVENASKANQSSLAELSQNAAALGQQLASNGVQQSSPEQIRGHGLGALGRAGAMELT